MTPTPTPEELRRLAGADPFENGWTPGAMERALRQRIDIMTREHAEERAEWNSDRDNYIRDVTMLINASGAAFDAPVAVADEISRTRRDMLAKIEAMEKALAWVNEVYPASLPHGGCSVDMTWEQFNAMRAAVGLKALPAPKKYKARAAISPPQGTE